ncbi:MAG: aminoacyl-tRNA hydrolase [Parcubacteria group bacterium]|nr:aminoacyl-tRNA hydrolase [Parcubacteria group bacterium]
MSWIIVGLGNPGAEYEKTHHNAGRMAVEHFAKKYEGDAWRFDKKANAQVAKVSAEGVSATCILPDTFMNKSGSAVVKYVKSVKAAQKLVVVYDDFDLPLGRIKISFARSAGGHKGVESIMRALKTDQFVRIRIGIAPENAKGNAKVITGEEKVLKLILGKLKPAEETELKKVFKRISDALATIVSEGHVKAMNEFN